MWRMMESFGGVFEDRLLHLKEIFLGSGDGGGGSKWAKRLGGGFNSVVGRSLHLKRL